MATVPSFIGAMRMPIVPTIETDQWASVGAATTCAGGATGGAPPRRSAASAGCSGRGRRTGSYLRQRGPLRPAQLSQARRRATAASYELCVPAWETLTRGADERRLQQAGCGGQMCSRGRAAGSAGRAACWFVPHAAKHRCVGSKCKACARR